MRRGELVSAALLLLAAAIVGGVRLTPLALPAVPEHAAAVVRGRIGAALAAEPGGARTPAEHARAIEQWIAAHPADFARDVAAESERVQAALRYEDGGGRRRVLLGDYDSYTWLRAARNALRTGTVCDAVVDGRCRDTYTLAPVGMTMIYGRSLHTAAIVAVHRFATWLDPHFPLPASAYLVPVLVGLLGVVPAFAIGRRLAGPLGGFVAAVVGGLDPVFLQRSLGSDDDVWNVVLPLYMVWAVIGGLQARRRLAQVAGGALGGAVAGLHAATWRGWTFAVVLAGLAGAAALHALRWVVGRHGWRVWQAPRVRTVAVVALAYYAAAAACTQAAGVEESAARLPLRLVAAAVPANGGAEPRSLQWPSALALVGELSVPTLGVIVAQSYGRLIFFVGWIGLLLLLLPRGQWREGHFVVLIGGTVLYRYLLTAAGLGRAVLVGLLALPLAAAAALEVSQGDDADAADADAGVLVAAWLLAALLISYQATRFALLLAAPFGIAAGVAIGRLHLWLDAAARQRFSTGARLPRLLLGAAVLTVAVVPVRIGYATAAAYMPAIDRAWADTLERLRSAAPPDAIVNTWWDYGYWTKYLAERRVSADGGTLLTHVPHWLARAELAAAEDQAVGLLRMLNCGSDALPYPEGAQGAFGKLTHHGIDDLAAYNAVVRLASLDRAAAERDLAGLGLDAPARVDVLAATHCAPPASYLVLSSQQIAFPGWWQLGTWDPNRGDDSGAVPARSGRGGFTTADWVACEPTGGGERRCQVGRADARGGRIDAVVYPDGDVHHTRVVSTAPGGEPVEAPPDLLLVADRDGVATFGRAATGDQGIAVLLDSEQQRALVGSPSAIGSIYTRLMFLDGRGTSHFRKVDERTGAWNQRVVTWAINWNP
jgi:hypothetical protein